MDLHNVIIILVTPLIIIRLLDEYYRRKGYKGIRDYLFTRKMTKARPKDEIDLLIDEKIWDAKNPNKYQTLYKHMYLYEREVSNGGHDQYFFNSAGNDWKEVREGLQLINATRILKVFDSAIAVFGTDGPSTDRDTRERQLREINSNSEIFAELDSQIYHSTEKGLYSYMRDFAAENLEYFKNGVEL